jgi:hypothetical protein
MEVFVITFSLRPDYCIPVALKYLSQGTVLNLRSLLYPCGAKVYYLSQGTVLNLRSLLYPCGAKVYFSGLLSQPTLSILSLWCLSIFLSLRSSLYPCGDKVSLSTYALYSFHVVLKYISQDSFLNLRSLSLWCLSMSLSALFPTYALYSIPVLLKYLSQDIVLNIRSLFYPYGAEAPFSGFFTQLTHSRVRLSQSCRITCKSTVLCVQYSLRVLNFCTIYVIRVPITKVCKSKE